MNPKSLKGRSLLTWINFTPDEIRRFLDLAKKVKSDSGKSIIRQRFKGKTLAIIARNPSMRMRAAFETAFGEEGGHPVFMAMQDASPGEQEPIEDLARSLGRMFSAVLPLDLRQEDIETLAKYAGLPVYNGFSDMFNPIQVLADLFTLEEEFGTFKGKKLSYVGYGRTNIARSLMVICSKMGADLSIVAPGVFWPDPELKDICRTFASESGSSLELTENQEEGVRGASALYSGSGISAHQGLPEKKPYELLIPYQVDAELITATGNPRCIHLYSLESTQASQGRAVAFDVFEGKQSRVFAQVENLKHVAKAIMLATL